MLLSSAATPASVRIEIKKRTRDREDQSRHTAARRRDSFASVVERLERERKGAKGRNEIIVQGRPREKQAKRAREMGIESINDNNDNMTVPEEGIRH